MLRDYINTFENPHNWEKSIYTCESEELDEELDEEETEEN